MKYGGSIALDSRSEVSVYFSILFVCYGVFSSSSRVEGCLRDFLMESGGSITSDSRSKVSFFDLSFWVCYGVFSDGLGVGGWWIPKECWNPSLFGCPIGFIRGNVKLRFCFHF